MRVVCMSVFLGFLLMVAGVVGDAVRGRRFSTLRQHYSYCPPALVFFPPFIITMYRHSAYGHYCKSAVQFKVSIFLLVCVVLPIFKFSVAMSCCIRCRCRSS